MQNYSHERLKFTRFSQTWRPANRVVLCGDSRIGAKTQMWMIAQPNASFVATERSSSRHIEPLWVTQPKGPKA
jgi:hypothetical protein